MFYPCPVAALRPPVNALPNALIMDAVCLDDTTTKAPATATIAIKMSTIRPICIRMLPFFPGLKATVYAVAFCLHFGVSVYHFPDTHSRCNTHKNTRQECKYENEHYSILSLLR